MALFHPGHIHSLINSNSPSDPPEILHSRGTDAKVTGSALTYGFNINYKSLLITGILFMLIVSWFDFVQTAFYSWYKPDVVAQDVGPAGVFWFCVLATLLGTLLIFGIMSW